MKTKPSPQPSGIRQRAHKSMLALTRLRHGSNADDRAKVVKKACHLTSPDTPAKPSDAHTSQKRPSAVDTSKSLGITITRSTRPGSASRHAMVTRGVSAAAARDAVFNTQELLEAILVQLPTKDLWTVGGVCRAWKDCVGASVRVRRGMFKEAVEKHTLLSYSPLTHTITLKQLSGPPSTTFNSDPTTYETTITTSTLNTLLFTPLLAQQRPSLVSRSTMCETLFFAPESLDLPGAWHDNKAKQSSGVLVANPAPTSVEVEVAYTLNRRKPSSASRALWPERHSITVSSGVRWGTILRELDIVLLCAQRRFAREELLRGKASVEGKVAVDVKRCKVWMRGVVFPTGEEMGTLMANGVLGERGVVAAAGK